MSETPLPTNAEETLNAIAAFEQILDAFPEDIATLEALYHAHESLAHSAEAQTYAMRTASAIESQPGATATPALLDRLRAMSDHDAEAARLAEALRNRVRAAAPLPRTSAPAPAAAPAVEWARGRTMEAEMALAWKLKEAGWIPEREYAQLVQDLSEISLTDHVTTLSLLHVMQDRGIANFESILTFISKDVGTGILPISSFDPHPDLAGLLPEDFMIRHGVVLFELIGKEALAAILNPYNLELRKEAERLSGRKCHFYLTTPTEFDAFTTRLRSPKK